jgi:hypothetical protein
MTGKPSDKPPNIPGRIGIVLTALLALVIHDAPGDTVIGATRPHGVPEAHEGCFFRWVGKAGLWLQAKLDPPKKSN